MVVVPLHSSGVEDDVEEPAEAAEEEEEDMALLRLAASHQGIGHAKAVIEVTDAIDEDESEASLLATRWRVEGGLLLEEGESAPAKNRGKPKNGRR